jgi:hypothetical protein
MSAIGYVGRGKPQFMGLLHSWACWFITTERFGARPSACVWMIPGTEDHVDAA